MAEESRPEPPRSLFGKLIRAANIVEDGILVGLLTTMIGLAVTQIVLRNLFNSGIIWSEALLRVLVLWVGLLGAMAATRDDRQITIDVLSRVLPERWKDSIRVITDVFTSVICAAVAWFSWRMVLMEYEFPTIAFGVVPTWVCQLVLPVAFLIIASRYAIFAVVHLREAIRGSE
jgi:TRAP-type C4-dicarboxylate transport system permease small subunit